MYRPILKKIMAQTYVGHSKSMSSPGQELLARTLTLVGLLAEIFSIDETTNHLSLVPFKQSIHYTDLTKLTHINFIDWENITIGFLFQQGGGMTKQREPRIYLPKWGYM